jgi:hypothetical protein
MGENIRGTGSDQGVDVAGRAARTAEHYRANPPTHAGAAPHAVVLDANDTAADIAVKLLRGPAEEQGDLGSLENAHGVWTEFKNEVATVEADTSLSEEGKRERLVPHLQTLSERLKHMGEYAETLEDDAVRLEREVDDEDGRDKSTTPEEFTEILSALTSGKMDPLFLGKKYMTICSKPKSTWTRPEGNLVFAVTRCHRSLGLDVVDPVLFDAGYGNLVNQSRNAGAISASRQRARLMRGTAGEIRAAAGKVAQKHGVDAAWAELEQGPRATNEAKVIDLPTTARDRARWGR